MTKTHESRLFTNIMYNLGRLIITLCHPYFEDSSPNFKPFRHPFETQSANFIYIYTRARARAHTHALTHTHTHIYFFIISPQLFSTKHYEVNMFKLQHKSNMVAPGKNTYHTVESPRRIMRKHVCLINYVPPYP
jgi:hypothetical protein